VTLADRLVQDAGPDEVFEAFEGWARAQGLSLYEHQEEALIELVSGANVILSTPTGSGKSLVATGAHFAALAQVSARSTPRPSRPWCRRSSSPSATRSGRPPSACSPATPA
jgi:hypothetical protein